MNLQYSTHKDVFTGLYHSILLGGEFDNCHGQGPTEESALTSLKMRVHQLRNLRKGCSYPKCGCPHFMC